MKTFPLTACLCFGILLLPAHAEPEAQTVTLHFQNGDYLTGDAVRLDDQYFLIDTAWGGEINVPRSAINGWTMRGHGYGSPWKLDRKSIEDVMTKEPGMEAPVVWGDQEKLAIDSPQYMVFSHGLPETYRTPIQVEMTVEFPTGKAGLDLFIVPGKEIGLWKSPCIMVRIQKNRITCMSYLSDQGNRDARYQSKPLPLPKDAPLSIVLQLDPEQNQFEMKLNGEDFLSWQEPEEAVPPGFTFQRVDWRFTGNSPVVLHHMTIRLAGMPPNEEDRIPPFVEMPNGDILSSKSIRWDEKGLWLEMEGIPPFPIPPERASSVWLTPPIPILKDPSLTPLIFQSDRGRSRLNLSVKEETGNQILYTHPNLPDPIPVSKQQD